MSTGRSVWTAMGILSAIAAIGSFFLIQVTKAFVGMVIMDWTSTLRSEGLITDARWNKLIDDMAPHLAAAFRFVTPVPMAFLLLAMVHFFVSWKLRAGTPPRRPSSQPAT
jgi:hypothetical protein